MNRNGASSAEVPIYVNLKGFRPDEAPTPDAVGQFIEDAVSRFNDIDIEAFVREALRLGGAGATRRSGPGWLLLFDSFDEIPEILSATDASGAVRAYAQAIADFVAIRQDRVRAIVASREFRGPAGFGLARFRIVSLTDPQQKTLIRRAVPDPASRRVVTKGVALPPTGFAQLLRNPMFLSLVCEYANLTGQFPEMVHKAYETCMTARIEKHMKAVGNKYGLTAAQLRSWAETAAFCMAVSGGLGLSPSRVELAEAMAQAGGPGPGQAANALDALVLGKLARDTDQLAGSGGPTFTFTHRRVQEYFATCVVLRTPGAVGPVRLLTDGRWRETAVTILQTQPPTAAGPLLRAAAEQLRDSLDGHTPGERFSWPDGALHTLGILAQGAPGPAGAGPPAQDVAGQVIGTAWTDGRIEEKAAVLTVVQCAGEAVTQEMVDRAFQSVSPLLRERAFQRLAGLRRLPASADLAVRRVLVDMWAGSQLWRQRTAIRVQLRRLPRHALPLCATAALPLLLTADLAVLAATAVAATTAPRAVWAPCWLAFLLLGLAHFGLRMQQDGMADSYAALARARPAMRLTRRILPSGHFRQVVGEVIRAVMPLPVALSLVLVRDRGPRDFAVIAVMAVAVAWPELFLDYLRNGRRHTLRKGWKRLGELRQLGWVSATTWLKELDRQKIRVGAGWAVLVVVVGGIAAIGYFASDNNESQPAASSGGSNFHLTHPEIATLNWIGVAVGVLIVVLAAWRAAGLWRESRASAIALREISLRGEPFGAKEMVVTLRGLRSRHALKAFLWTLRARPVICLPDAMSILSDLACAARQKPVANLIPSGSSPQYTAWARHERGKSLRRVLGWLDQGAIDDIVLLGEQVRALEQG